MKARKTMKNQPLIQEVIAQISQRFAPKIPDIKKVKPTTPLITISPLLIPFLAGYRPPSGEGIH